MSSRDYAPLSPRPPIVTAWRFWLTVLSLLTLLASAAEGADCVPDGTTVTCTGSAPSDPGGFDAAGVDGYQVDVLPDAVVDDSDPPGVNALDLASNNTVNVQAGVEPQADGKITASNPGSHGIAALDANTFMNEGSIVVTGAGGHGIAAGDNNNVRNPGSIVVTGAGGRGVSLGDESNVQSRGTIDVSGGSNWGVFAGDNSALRNRSGGIITAADASSVGLEAGSNECIVQNDTGAEIIMEGDDSVAIKVGSDNSQVWNQAGGVITLEGNDSVGIQVGDRTALVQNNGTITANGTDGFGMVGGDDNLVINAGTVTASGPGGIGVQLGTAAGIGNTIENQGIITGGSGSGAAVSFAPSGSGTQNSLVNWTDAEVDGSASGVAIRGSAGADIISNEGTITGDVGLEDGDDAFALWTGGVIDGAVAGGAGSDTLWLLGSGTDALDLAVFSDFDVLNVAGSGTWTLSGAGSFPEGATVTNGSLALAGEVDLTGDYTQGTGTSLVVTLNPDGTNDRLDVSGNATIEAGATLDLVPSEPLIDEATYTFLTTTGTLTGLFDELNFPEEGGALSFTQIATANSLSIEFSRIAYANAAATANQRATGRHLDGILAAGPTPDMQTVLTSLDTLSGSELQAALDALHPEPYDAQANAILSFGRSVAELAAFRRPRCEKVVYERRPQIVAPAACSRSWMPWGSAFGLFAKRDGGGSHIDFDHAGGGLLLGADHPLGEHFLAYGFFGGGYADVEVDSAGEGHLFGATLGAGGRWSLGGTRIHGLVGYARGWHEQERRIDFGDISRTAKADYTSNLILALVKAGHTFRFGSLELEPLATVEYGYLMEDSFGESGAGDLDLDVDKRSNSVLSTTAGARLAYMFFKWEYIEDWLEWADGVWTPELSARWRGNWIGRERDLDARMVGAPAGVSGFTVGGQDAEQGVQLGASVVFQPLRLLMSIRVDYAGFYGDGSTIHRIGASIRVPLGGSAG